MAKAKATKTKAKIKNPLGLAPYDPADYLRTPKEVAMYLEAFFEDGVDHEVTSPIASKPSSAKKSVLM